MRRLPALALFACSAWLATSLPAPGQAKKQPAKDANKFAPPPATKPDDATLRQIADKTAQLRAAVGGLAAKNVADDVVAEVEVYARGAENVVKFGEFYHKDTVRWTLKALDDGLKRAKDAEGGQAAWRAAAGRWVVRAYRSKVDGTAQPYAVMVPEGFGADGKKHRLDVVLHGRDSSLTEVKFLTTHDGAKPGPKQDFVQLEVLGRGNNAYRWAGETDVMEAVSDFFVKHAGLIDPNRVVLRGFSMGGAGTWHLGLHHPFRWAVIGPGAGFSVTRGYAKVPDTVPAYVEKCWHIYDAADYAENAFNVPVVAYSGALDPQKAAADNIERALNGFKEPFRFKHIVAPGLEHKMPPEWWAKVDGEIRATINARPPHRDRVRFVTYTSAYGEFGLGTIVALSRLYEKAVVDGRRVGERWDFTTSNVRELEFAGDGRPTSAITVDGQTFPVRADASHIHLVRADGRWTAEGALAFIERRKQLRKAKAQTGPIDAAFTDQFEVIPPAAEGWHPAVTKYAAADVKRFAGDWERYFRGTLPVSNLASAKLRDSNVILFGDPGSNPLLAKMLPLLPMTWTREKLVVNGKQYDPKTHIPVMIYPHPDTAGKYVVVNSGHTFREADLKGTNANLYPRLGDWAVLKIDPAAKDATAYEVVDAGLFDEFWQFQK